jgi:glycerophosphoryl diester phosphodiesterase
MSIDTKLAEIISAHNLACEKQPKIIWHKCNNISMLKEAVSQEIIGVAGLEYDVVETKDGVPVLFHDKIITEKVIKKDIAGKELAAQNTIEISALTASELRNLRPDIPTLEEAFIEIDKMNFSDNFEFHLEIKPSGMKLWDIVKAVLQKFPRINKQTLPRSFQDNIIAYIAPEREICLLLCGPYEDKAIYFPLSGKTIISTLPSPEKIKEICGGYKPRTVSLDYNILNKDLASTEDFIRKMHDAGIKVEAYTLNELKEIGGTKVDAIVTDVPKHILNEISANKKIPSHSEQIAFGII